MKNKWLLGVLVTAGILGWPEIGRGLLGESGPPNARIQVQWVDDTLVAVGASAQTAPFSLGVDEQVREVRSRGSVAAVLTSDRFLAISETAADWLETPFALNEGDEGRLVLSENMVLVDTQDRVLAFDGVANRMIAYDLPAGERVFERAADLNVLVFATEYRAAGLAAGGDWETVDFAVSEIFRGLNADADRATVQTSTRRLTFSAAAGGWSTP